jgi:hypothetical protein
VREGVMGRPRTVARPDRKQESARALAERLPADAWQMLPCRTTPAGEEEISGRFAFVRVVAAHPVLRDHLPARYEWLIIEWPENEDAPIDYWLSNLPEDESSERLARLARLRWTIELNYRQLKRRTRTRPLRRPQLRRLPPPHGARHLRARLPDRGTARSKSPALGVTLPQTVLLLQPVLRCWADRCRTCQQPVDLDQLTLFHRRE